MNTQELTSYLDELLFSKTGEHLDSLQLSVIRGVLNGKKYADIAKEYNCSAGHVKDEAYKLWQLLSDTLGEDINKSNFCATVQRVFGKNNYGIVVNSSQVDQLNFCPSSPSNLEENDDIIPDDQIMANAIEKKTKRETIPRLVKLGLTPEQIAEALDLLVPEVKKIIASQSE
ncbi:MAG: hypothetical protein EWV41_17430 [Microcystis wesenbergii Mw_MB_S_20031200_S109]|uniref:vWA-MoxR associated protein N-terminal HTH domain-containing protein n=1 Tax=Microcystis wesenbergii Mw_MB_S_20031200_S109D TaxID=2486241 RepID=A0A552M2M9_9CHRO|nr:MAG: hypothetical protein EWV41_17430 [Microcystis wesenbergii Mw_MB_S_20031200_S109]TRV26729.1 MAG: hypothetical protein EWV88_06015 [Microcystis wesenbergii Mw_MB_S_20031200_S109D]